MDLPMYLIWLILAIVLGVAEAVSLGLSSLWFAIGAAVACIIAMVGGPLILQIAAFFGVSIILLIFTRPILVKKLKMGDEKTNVDAVIGKLGIVTQEIEPYKTGRVYISGLDWTAAVKNGMPGIEKDTKVKVIAIEGVKAIVEPAIEE
ncbi:MAG: NfeD family protein [Peptostreptococcaceae bacterium]|nr:NfeD family protein [Peptostreptococcaceae bacterium]